MDIYSLQLQKYSYCKPINIDGYLIWRILPSGHIDCYLNWLIWGIISRSLIEVICIGGYLIWRFLGFSQISQFKSPPNINRFTVCFKFLNYLKYWLLTDICNSKVHKFDSSTIYLCIKICIQNIHPYFERGMWSLNAFIFASSTSMPPCWWCGTVWTGSAFADVWLHCIVRDKRQQVR